jgi:hypothetical protein
MSSPTPATAFRILAISVLSKISCSVTRSGAAAGFDLRGADGLLEEVRVQPVVLDELRPRRLVLEELVGLLVALADPRDVAGQGVRLLVVAVQVLVQPRAVAGDAGAELLQRGQRLHDPVDLLGREDVPAGEARQDDILRPELEEYPVELLVVVDVLLALLALDPVERRLGDVDDIPCRGGRASGGRGT